MQELSTEPEILNDGSVNELGDIQVDWKNPPSLMSLKKNFEDARIDQQKHVADIDGWLDRLHVRNSARRKKRQGRSTIVPKVIRRQAEWRYSSLTEPFTGPRELFKAHPVTWDDKEAAIQNQLILNNQFNHRIDRGEFIDEYVRTGVDQGTIVCRVGWEFEDKTVDEEQPTFVLIPDPEFAETLEEITKLKELNPNKFEFDVPYELKEALEKSIEAGQPLRPEITGSEVIQKQKIIKNQPTVEVVDYRNVLIDPTCNGKAEKANFIIYTYEASKAELEKTGKFFNLDKINTNLNDIISEPDHAAQEGSNNFNFEDDARKKFVVKEYWGFLDVEGKGELTPIVCSWVGNTFIQAENNPFPDQMLPFVWVKYMPVNKQVYGEPDGALLEDHQDVMGAIMRGMIDILARSANAQTGRRRDMLDTVNKLKYERGEDYEYNGQVDPRQAFFMHKFEEIPNSAQFMMQLMNAEAEGLTGVKAFSNGLQSGELGDVATAVRGVLDSASKRELGILRRLASGLVKIAKKITAMNGEFLSDMEVVRITNEEFVPVRREELNGEFDLELTISTAEEDDAKAKELAFMLQTMGNNVDFSVTKKILVEMFRLRKMPTLANEIEQYEPQPDPMEQQMQQLQLQEMQAKIELLQSQAQENQAEAGLDQMKAQQLQVNAEKASIEADKMALDHVEQEEGVTHEREMQKQGAQARANIELEREKQRFKQEENAQKTAGELQKNLLNNYIKATRSKPVKKAS